MPDLMKTQKPRSEMPPKGKPITVAITTLGVLLLGGAGYYFYATNAGQTNAKSCAPMPAHYTMTPIGSHQFNVELLIAGDTEQLDIVSRKDVTAQILTDDFIKNVRQVDKDGAETPLDYVGVGSWQLNGDSTENMITVRYQIDANHDDYKWPNGKEEVAYNFDDASYFVGWTVLLTDYSRQNCTSTIEFDTPAGWDVAAPWQKMDEKTYRIADINSLQKNGFAIGPDLPRFDIVAGQSSLTITYERAVADIAENAAANADNLFSYYQQVYGDAASDRYHVFMVSDEGTDGGAFEASFAQRFSIPSNKADTRVWQHGFAHEIGHLWNGIALKPVTPADAEWFKEGVTDYLAAKAMYAIGAINEGQLEDRIATMLRRYYLAISTNGPMSLVHAGGQKQKNRMLVYGGGAVFALLLDAEMHKSQGAKAFERMLASLYASRQAPYTQQQLISILDHASNGLASMVLSAVEDGLMPAEMKQRLANFKLGLGVFAPEELYITFDVEGCDSDNGACVPAFLNNRR